MFTVQGKIVAVDTFESKKKEKFNTLSLYTEIENFGKMKPKLFEDIFFPDSLLSLMNCLNKDVILPCNPMVKNGKVDISISDGGRPILVKNDKGEFHKLTARPESLGSSKTG